MKDTNRGYYKKYIIFKPDGELVDPNADYFVLRLDTDPAARKAMLAYAEAIKHENPQLHYDLLRRYELLESGRVIDIAMAYTGDSEKELKLNSCPLTVFGPEAVGKHFEMSNCENEECEDCWE